MRCMNLNIALIIEPGHKRLPCAQVHLCEVSRIGKTN